MGLIWFRFTELRRLGMLREFMKGDSSAVLACQQHGTGVSVLPSVIGIWSSF